MEKGLKPWVENKLVEQSRKIQGRLDSFEQQVTHQLGSGQTPDILEVKVEVAELRNLVNELNERPIFPTPVITKVHPKVEIENIWSVPIEKEGGKKKNNKKIKMKSTKYENLETMV